LIAINSNDAGSYADRGAVKIRMKDRKGGAKDLKQAIKMYRKAGEVQKAQGLEEILKKVGA
jgi:regulator of sirC expression with transglutaminase-like and TPR domain